MEKNVVHALECFDERTQVMKMRTKIFNERKTTRLRAYKRLNELRSVKKTNSA